MKHYRKPLLAQNQEINKKLTVFEIFKIFFSWLIFLFISATGLVHSEIISQWGQAVDIWFESLQNKIYAAIICAILLGLFGAIATYYKLKRM